MNDAARRKLARLGRIVADDLALRLYAAAPVVRRLADAVEDDHPDVDAQRCACGCGRALKQPATGRRKKYFDDRCRWRAAKRYSKAPRKSVIGA